MPTVPDHRRGRQARPSDTPQAVTPSSANAAILPPSDASPPTDNSSTPSRSPGLSGTLSPPQLPNHQSSVYVSNTPSSAGFPPIVPRAPEGTTWPFVPQQFTSNLPYPPVGPLGFVNSLLEEHFSSSVFETSRRIPLPSSPPISFSSVSSQGRASGGAEEAAIADDKRLVIESSPSRPRIPVPSSSRTLLSSTPSQEGASNDPEEAVVLEDKRRRNTAASARFRIKKKQKNLNLERTVTDLTSRAEELEREVTSLRRENSWLKEMVILKGRQNMGNTGRSSKQKPSSDTGESGEGSGSDDTLRDSQPSKIKKRKGK